jgi:hypothetical protein
METEEGYHRASSYTQTVEEEFFHYSKFLG